MKMFIAAFAAVMLSAPLLAQARTAPPSPRATTTKAEDCTKSAAQSAAQPDKKHRCKVVALPLIAGTNNAVIGSTAISGGEIGLMVGGALFVAVAAGAGGGSSHKGSNDCHCGGGGGTTGTTGTTAH